MRFLGRSVPGSQVISGSTLGSEVVGCSVPVVSPGGSDWALPVDLELLLSAGSQAGLPEASEVRSLVGSEVIFLRQDA